VQEAMEQISQRRGRACGVARTPKILWMRRAQEGYQQAPVAVTLEGEHSPKPRQIPQQEPDDSRPGEQQDALGNAPTQRSRRVVQSPQPNQAARSNKP